MLLLIDNVTNNRSKCISVCIFIDFGTWVTLTELNLGTNQLSSVPEEIQELTRLEILVLANNTIRVSVLL